MRCWRVSTASRRGCRIPASEQRSPARLCKRALPALLLIAGCGSGGGGGGDPGPDPGCDPSSEYCDSVPLSADPCSATQYWPRSVRSGQRPLIVHFSRATQAGKAAEVLALLEESWSVQVDQLGFSPPLPDGGDCGPDADYDVFVWPGVDGAYVQSIASNPATPHDDYTTFMAIDPFGAYGDEYLDTTLAHEFNHAVQASDDWWESATIFEMTATFVEALVYPDQDDYYFTLEDFQSMPGWSVFYDDGYRSWQMYGAAMFLHFLRERHYPADPGFIARTWRASRSNPPDPRPDYLDALRDLLLAERGVDLDEAFVEFMQWRWFVAEFDDSAHFEQGADWPYPVAWLEADAADASISVTLEAMLYGGAYLRIVNDGAAARTFTVDLTASDVDTDWRVSDVDAMPVLPTISVPPNSAVTIVAAVLPRSPESATSLDFDLREATLTLTAL